MIFVFLQTRCNVLKWRSVSLRALWFGKRGEKQAHATVLDVMYGTTQGKQSRLLCVHKVPPEGLRREGRGNIPARLEINNNPQISDTTIDSNHSTQFFGHFEPLPLVLIKGLCTIYMVRKQHRGWDSRSSPHLTLFLPWTSTPLWRG